ncbi:hypothetical protein D9M72_622830 [compost metagenome]
MLVAQAAQHVRAFHARQHPVQDQRVVVLGGGQVQAGDAIGGDVEDMATRFEVLEQVGDQLAVVFNDQEPHVSGTRGRWPPW